MYAQFTRNSLQIDEYSPRDSILTVAKPYFQIFRTKLHFLIPTGEKFDTSQKINFHHGLHAALRFMVHFHGLYKQFNTLTGAYSPGTLICMFKIP